MSGVMTFCGRLVSSAARIVSADLTRVSYSDSRGEPGGVRGHDKPAFGPGLARPVGAEQLRQRLDGRFDRQHVKTRRGDVAVAQQIQERIEIDDRPARGVDHHRACGQQSEPGMAEHTPGFGRQGGVDRQSVGLPQQILEAGGTGRCRARVRHRSADGGRKTSPGNQKLVPATRLPCRCGRAR